MLFSFLVKLVVFGVVLAATGAPVKSTASGLLFPAFGLLAVGTVAGMLAPIGLLYKDIEQVLTVIVMPLMFLTPVVYPAPPAGVVGTITRLNPLTPMFRCLREFLFGGVGPYVAELGVVCAVTLVLASGGWLVYRLSLPILIERLEAWRPGAAVIEVEHVSKRYSRELKRSLWYGIKALARRSSGAASTRTPSGRASSGRCGTCRSASGEARPSG